MELGSMPAGLLVAVGMLAVIITQYLKFASVVPDRWGPVAVVAVALTCEGLWVVQEGGLRRELALGYLFDVVNIAATAAGVYGFARAALPESVTTVRKPPPGAFQGPTAGV